MTGGLLVALGGVWLLCQVFGGNALDRIGLTGNADDRKAAQAAQDAQDALDAQNTRDALQYLYDPNRAPADQPNPGLPGTGLADALGKVNGSIGRGM